MKKPKLPSPYGYIVSEPKPGHLNIVCEVSGKPYTRANKHGMFCAENCECEIKAIAAHEELLKIMKGLM